MRDKPCEKQTKAHLKCVYLSYLTHAQLRVHTMAAYLTHAQLRVHTMDADLTHAQLRVHTMDAIKGSTCLFYLFLLFFELL